MPDNHNVSTSLSLSATLSFDSDFSFCLYKGKWRMQHELNVGGGKAWSRSDGARRGLCSGGARWSGGSHGCGGAAERTRPLGLTARMTM